MKIVIHQFVGTGVEYWAKFRADKIEAVISSSKPHFSQSGPANIVFPNVYCLDTSDLSAHKMEVGLEFNQEIDSENLAFWKGFVAGYLC